MKVCWCCGGGKAHVNSNGVHLCLCGHRWWDTGDGHTEYFSWVDNFSVRKVENGLLFVIAESEERL